LLRLASGHSFERVLKVSNPFDLNGPNKIWYQSHILLLVWGYSLLLGKFIIGMKFTTIIGLLKHHNVIETWTSWS